MESYNLIAKTLHGLEPVLADELKQLGAQNIIPLKRAVSFAGYKFLLYQATYNLRTALSILKPVTEFKVRNEDDLYRGISRIQWNKFMNLNSTFAIQSTVNSRFFKHSKYVALKSKDAIVDQFRRKTGKRPSIDTEIPDLKINIHIANDICTVSLDSSGEPLYKRGYRIEGHKAPLNEVLAAGMIKLSGWDMKKTLIDPMCGSGTIPIEAALMATNTPAGYLRETFGFMSWGDYDEELFEKVKKESRIIEKPDCGIIGSDISRLAFDIANKNLQKAGVRDYVKIKKIAFEDFSPPQEEGFLLTNPPFGERIQKDDLNNFYSVIGSRLKHQYHGYEAWLLSSNFEALKHIGLHPSMKYILFNGALECKFQQFRIYARSKKTM